ncbi:hypothetical protein [Pseudomonas sp. Teo4]|uniref:hypothetical protein n=1 Tax=Pseudomonas sp. Teo4 TaxID=3064528 RepID=UPI002ACB085C|nr:hypothetical protein [Pseudomonas sp. Teo4]
MGTFRISHGFTLTLCWVVFICFVDITNALADKPTAERVERTAQVTRLTLTSDTPLTVTFSPCPGSGADCSVNADSADAENQATQSEGPEAPITKLQRIARALGSIPDTQVWIQALTVCLVIFSAYLSLRTARISRLNVQVDAFQKLRAEFLSFSTKLPIHFWTQQELPEGDCESYDELRAMERYWFQSFDEWYITQVLHPNTLGHLWDTYYRNAILKNRESAAMIAALIHTKKHTGATLYKRFYRMVVYQGWWRISTYRRAEELANTWEAHIATQKKLRDAALKDTT